MKDAEKNIARPIEILVGLRSIATFLKISSEKIRDMEQDGAPMFRDASGVLRAEKAELWTWWKEKD